MNIDRALAIIAHGESNSLKDLSEAGQLIVKRLDAENQALRADAERYRALVDSGKYSPDPCGLWGLCLSRKYKSSKKELDAAIDAAKGGNRG